jgi:flavin reductase (DIM6/NTAB) family NADH-FMN oxidoreductase RutF/pimeloyl-ACP methyl ester carboxylesterase
VALTSDCSDVVHRLRGRDGVSTRHLRDGARSGEAVVLIHGVGMNASVWAPQVRALSTAYDVIAYDMLGHGGTDLPPADARLADYVEQLLGLLDALGVERAHVIGHSMGALVALDFALTYPRRVRSVSALNAVYCRSEAQRDGVLRRVSALQSANDRAVDAETIARWFGEPVPTALAEPAQATVELLRAVDPIGYARAYRVFATADEAHKGRLRDLTVPALFMTGELDPNSTPEMSRAMAREAPGGCCEIVPGARHMMALTASAEVNARLASFLDRCSTMRLPASQPVDTRALRQALGAFVTGVTIVSARQHDGEPRGFTANSFTSVSLDPPLVLVCIARTAASYPVFSAVERFSVSVLAEDQKHLSQLFASKAPDKFSRAPWHASVAGTPLIEGSAAWFDCRRYRSVIDAGDHVILVGEVVEFGDSKASPLAYGRGAYVAFGLSQDAVAAAEGRTRVGAILECDGGVVLVEDRDGNLDLPTGRRLEPETDPASLRGVLKELGVTARLSFLFAVFEDPRTANHATSIYYRGTAEPVPAGHLALRHLRFDRIPWGRLRDPAVRSMLARFVREREEDTFGVYVGDADRGTVQALARAALPSSCA